MCPAPPAPSTGADTALAIQDGQPDPCPASLAVRTALHPLRWCRRKAHRRSPHRPPRQCLVVCLALARAGARHFPMPESMGRATGLCWPPRSPAFHRPAAVQRQRVGGRVFPQALPRRAPPAPEPYPSSWVPEGLLPGRPPRGKRLPLRPAPVRRRFRPVRLGWQAPDPESRGHHHGCLRVTRRAVPGAGRAPRHGPAPVAMTCLRRPKDGRPPVSRPDHPHWAVTNPDQEDPRPRLPERPPRPLPGKLGRNSF